MKKNLRPVVEEAPSSPKSFEDAWIDIEPRLRSALRSRAIPAHDAEDAVQETAIRLMGYWAKVDHERPLVPLATKIAFNFLCDRSRRHKRLVHEVHDRASDIDVEQQSLNRIELQRVAAAMRRLRVDQREVILAGLDAPEEHLRSAAKTRMQRMRARRRLVSLLEAASAWVLITRARLHHLASNSTRDLAVAVTAGALLVSAGVVAPIHGVPAGRGHHTAVGAPTSRSAAAARVPSGTRSAHTIGRAPESAVAVATSWPATHGVLHTGSAPAGEHVDAEISADPSDETVIGADSNGSSLKIRRGKDDSYSACVRVVVGPSESGNCD